jgi:cell division protein ZapA (FtsZ GTPase activity inhibitor)|tara:strand:+ start:326 stop:535 length:210 start_codon:yes stop_codon:yes gene_type:complete
MSKKQKEQTITINDKEYKVSDLSQDQLTYINHINDLDRKIVSSQFNLDQLSVGKNAFMNALNTSLEPVA